MLYYIRFALICRNRKPGEPLFEFADLNKKEDAAPVFYETNSKIKIDPDLDELDKALELARYLRKAIKGGRGLGLASDRSLKVMLDGQGGICSDYSQMFNIFCLINDIRVREWGIVEKFYNPIYGHTFNEVYSSKLQDWVVIDFQKNLYFVKENDNRPLSATALFSYLREGKPLTYHYFSDHVCIDMHKIAITYSKQTIPFVISDYNNREYDKYLNKYQKYPPFVINAMMILMRKNYRFVFPLDDYTRKFFHRTEKTS